MRKQYLLIAAGLCVSLGVEAAGPTATTGFWIEDRETNKRKPASEARLDQYVCLSIRAELVPIGEHSLQVTIYDGLGNEVLRSARRAHATSPSLRRSMCFGADEEHDAPGTWWYVVELDGQPLVSTSIEVRPLTFPLQSGG